MYKMDLAPRFYCHEIGHGIIAFLYHEEYYNFEGITFDKKRIEEIGLNPLDKGYAITFPVDNLEELIKENPEHSAAIDGLLLLGGIAGSTYLPPSGNCKKNIFNGFNFKSMLDTRGSEGDFEIIDRARRPYGKLIYSYGNITNEAINDTHCKILKILEDIFLIPDVQKCSQLLYDKLTNSGNLFIEDFQEVLDEKLTKTLKLRIENLLISDDSN